MTCHACIGGKSIGEDIRALQAGVQVVSGTPGRVYDMIQRRTLNTKKLKVRCVHVGGRCDHVMTDSLLVECVWDTG